MADADRGHVDGQVTRRKGSGWRELPVLVIVAFALALLIKAVLLQAFFIPSGSMEQTLRGCPGCTGDRVLVNKLVYDVREIKRGDIVVFHGRGSWDGDASAAAIDRGNLVRRALGVAARSIGALAPGEKDYIKRVIGLPGDRVACCTADGHVTVQTASSDVPVALDEPYVFEDDHQPFCADGSDAAACPPGARGVLVPPDALWVMGDHRSASADSRANRDRPGNGTIPQDAVIGRAFAIVWPLPRAGFLPTPDSFR